MDSISLSSEEQAWARGPQTRQRKRLVQLLRERKDPPDAFLSLDYSGPPVTPPGWRMFVHLAHRHKRLRIPLPREQMSKFHAVRRNMDRRWWAKVTSEGADDSDEDESALLRPQMTARALEEVENRLAGVQADYSQLRRRFQAAQEEQQQQIRALERQNEQLRRQNEALEQRKSAGEVDAGHWSFIQIQLKQIRQAVRRLPPQKGDTKDGRVAIGSKAEPFLQGARTSPNIIKRFNHELQRKLFTKKKKDGKLIFSEQHMRFVFGKYKVEIQDVLDEGVGASWLFGSYWNTVDPANHGAAASVADGVGGLTQQRIARLLWPGEGSKAQATGLPETDELLIAKLISSNFSLTYGKIVYALIGCFESDESGTKQNMTSILASKISDEKQLEQVLDRLWKLHETWRALGAIAALALSQGVKLPRKIYSPIVMADIMGTTFVDSINDEHSLNTLQMWDEDDLIAEMSSTFQEKLSAEAIEEHLEVIEEDVLAELGPTLAQRFRCLTNPQRLAYARAIHSRRFALSSMRRGFQAIHVPLVGSMVSAWTRLDGSFRESLYGAELKPQDVILLLDFDSRVIPDDRRNLQELLLGYGDEDLRAFLKFATDLETLPPPGEMIRVDYDYERAVANMEASPQTMPMATTCHKTISLVRGHTKSTAEQVWTWVITAMKEGTLDFLEDQRYQPG